MYVCSTEKYVLLELRTFVLENRVMVSMILTMTSLILERYNVNIANSTCFEQNENIINLNNDVLILRTFATQMRT